MCIATSGPQTTTMSTTSIPIRSSRRFTIPLRPSSASRPAGFHRIHDYGRGFQLHQFQRRWRMEQRLELLLRFEQNGRNHLFPRFGLSQTDGRHDELRRRQRPRLVRDSVLEFTGALPSRPTVYRPPEERQRARRQLPRSPRPRIKGAKPQGGEKTTQRKNDNINEKTANRREEPGNENTI